ncbi:SsrA-binding protein SmpB [Eubacteriales bacterium OttesenSCG-928-M02]|nr:SsrA-binding protein SmpB [Eubacteriales bacterium OttesenSCG-928-M02]
MERKKKTIITNRRARHEYHVEDTYEAGMVLFGTEVKSIRQGKANLTDAYVRITNGEAFVIGMYISPYEQGNLFNRDPLREKKLLLHKREIKQLAERVGRDGYTLIPLSLYFFGNHLKMEVGVCRGKKLYDKRQSIKARDDVREMERAAAQRRREE